MHYKCYLFTKHVVDRGDIDKILSPFREDFFNQRIWDTNDDMKDYVMPKFLYDNYQIGGAFKYIENNVCFWDGHSLPQRSIEKLFKTHNHIFDPSKCFCVLDETGRCFVRDEFQISIETCERPDYLLAAQNMAIDYEDGCVTILDIHIF